MACCHDVWDCADSKPLGSVKLRSAAEHTGGYCRGVLILARYCFIVTLSGLRRAPL